MAKTATATGAVTDSPNDPVMESVEKRQADQRSRRAQVCCCCCCCGGGGGGGGGARMAVVVVLAWDVDEMAPLQPAGTTDRRY
jgi:hypothetical protein